MDGEHVGKGICKEGDGGFDVGKVGGGNEKETYSNS